MVSPIFEVSTTAKSKWREDVKATWAFLESHYSISANITCATHIHISLVPEYELRDVQRVAASVIHFESAIEALVPVHRRINSFVKRNWLEGDGLARKGKSRADSIIAIEAAESIGDVCDMVGQRGEKNFAWNFEALDKYETIEFRKPPASVSSDQALCWAELVLNFVQAAVRNGTSEKLRNVPATVGGLQWFLRQVHEPGVNEPRRLDELWAGKDPNEAEETDYH